MNKNLTIKIDSKVVLTVIAAIGMLLASSMSTRNVWAEEVSEDMYISVDDFSEEMPEMLEETPDEMYEEVPEEMYEETPDEMYEETPEEENLTETDPEEYDEFTGDEPEENPFEKEAKNYPPEFFRGHEEGEEIVDPDGEYDDPLGEKAYLASLPESPNQFISGEDLFDYYRLTDREVGIYDLKPGKVYYMNFQPMHFSALVNNDYFVAIDKVWEQERGGLFKVFGDFTQRTIQYRDMITGEVCYNRPLSSDLRFFELEKIQSVTDPSLKNHFS